MKKIMFLALPALMLASCSSDDVVNEARAGINFEPGLNRGSRALETNTANLGEFNVTAYGNGAVYFSDVTIAQSANGWDSEYLWPSYDLNFVAYSPAEFGGTPAITHVTQKLNNVQVEQKLADQKDIVVARNAGTVPGEKVQLTFEHALTAIQVKAKLGNSNLRYEIMAVKLCNLKDKGTFTYPAVKNGTGRELEAFDLTAWSLDSKSEASYITRGDATNPVVLDKVGEVKDLMAVENDFFMPMPQTTTGWNKINNADLSTGAYISILCRVYQSDNKGGETLLFPYTDDKSVNLDGKYSFAALPLEYTFQPGNKYTIVLNLDGGGYIDPDPTDPDPEDPDPDDPIIPTPDPDDPDDPDPILPGKISYDVIVNPWVDGGNIDLNYTPETNN